MEEAVRCWTPATILIKAGASVKHADFVDQTTFSGRIRGLCRAVKGINYSGEFLSRNRSSRPYNRKTTATEIREGFEIPLSCPNYHILGRADLIEFVSNRCVVVTEFKSIACFG